MSARSTQSKSMPRATTAIASVAGGAAGFAVTDLLDGGLATQAIVFAVVAALGLLIPSLRLTDPATRQPLTRDSSISSVILSLASALLAAYSAGDLPVPDEMRAAFVAVLAALTGTHVPSAVGSALGRRKPSRSDLADRV